MAEIIILGKTDLAPVSSRLKAAGPSLRVTQGSSIEALDVRSRGRVYLVPFETVNTPDWPRLRTELSRANRYYVVYGGTLSTRLVVEACRDGAFDVLSYEDPPPRWVESLAAAAKAQSTWVDLYGGTPIDTNAVLIGNSDATDGLRRTIERLGPTPASVLILGESGVGKEKVAEALHRKSGGAQLIALNCAAVPADLLESELFGVAKGAYTGAAADRPGLVEQASGGTLFLDEIGELQLNLQAKLLRFIQSRRARRVGGTGEYEVNVRIVSATNRDLEEEVAAGRFRADLYYRLAEVSLRVPPLRQRREDIPVLARHFLTLAGERFGKFFDAVEPALLEKFQQHDWPGNVRELKSAIDRLVLLFDGPILRAGWWDAPTRNLFARAAAEVPAPVVAASNAPAALTAPAPAASPLPAPTPVETTPELPSRRGRMELARRLLAEGGHDLAWVAARAGVHPTTLFRWRKSGLL